MLEHLRYDFDDRELRQLGLKLAQATRVVYDLESEKKDETARFGAALKHANLQVADLAWKLNCGYELREVECMVLLDTPHPGMKHIIRADTMAFVREELMTAEERQGQLFSDLPGTDS
jgi:hypothetical protein